MAKKPKKPTPAPKKKPQSAKARSKPAPKAKPPAKKAAKPVSKSKPAPKAAAKKAPPPKAKPSQAKASSKAKAPKPKPTVVKKAPVKSSPKKASAPAAKPAASSKAPAAKAVPAKAPPATQPKPAAKPAAEPRPVKPAAGAKEKSRASLRSSILAKRGVKAAKPVAFSLDEVREIAKTAKTETESAETHAAQARAAAVKAKLAEAAARPAAPNHVKTASLADILGFNPTAKKAAPADESAEIPEKFRRYHKLLLDLRAHLTGQLDTHTEETLKRSSKDDSGDLSSYGQHMADAGTDTFDRDFALSLVSSEQEALSEVEAAIKRIKNGTYGICEVTGKPIARERLLAVPFTRHSAEAQKEIEKTRYRARAQSGLFGEFGEETASLGGGDGDDE